MVVRPSVRLAGPTPIMMLEETISWAADGEGDALWNDILSFLDAPLSTSDVSSTESGSDVRQSSPHKRRAPRDRGHVKRTLDHLRGEVQELTCELQRLRGRPQCTAMETALTERLKRRRAEDECQRLRDTVFSQAKFLRGLKSVFSTPPPFTSYVNLCQYFHKYMRLPSDKRRRWGEYATLAQETRLSAAINMLCRETQGIPSMNGYDQFLPSVSVPHIQADLLQTVGGFGVTTMNVFAVESSDIGSVLRATCVAVRDILSLCQSYMCLAVDKKIVDPDATLPATDSSILYRITGVHHKSKSDDDELSIESRAITLYRQTKDYALVLWDFVDDDELNPVSDSADITRQSVGASLIRREACDDGLERVVFRSLSTRQYRFHEHGPVEVLDRFKKVTETTMRANELLFRGILLNEVAEEQVALDVVQ